jgi:alpha-galactosidase
VRNEMFLHLDYYVTESSGHNSEYNWWFRKRPDLIEKYCTHGTGWNPGEYAYILKEYQQRDQTWKEEVEQWFASDNPISLERGQEYAAYIINALQGGEPFPVQRQCSQYRVGHQPAAGCVCGSAGVGQQKRLRSGACGRAPAAVCCADVVERSD